MGCCVSTPKTQKHQSFESKSPPPSVLEDQETIVKEVLSVSETTKLPQQHQLQHQQRQPFVDEVKNVRENRFNTNENRFRDRQEQDETETETVLSEQEVLSEVCSLSPFSESLSTTTTTNTTTLNEINIKRELSNIDSDNEESFGASYHQEVKQKEIRSQSPASRTGPTNRLMGKSPTRRSDQSPVRKVSGGLGGGGGGGGGGGVSMRLVQSSRDNQVELGNSGQLGRVGIRRSGLRSDHTRRDPGEVSARRSRSPATNRSVTGSSPSAQRTNRSAGRARSDTNGNVDGGATPTKWETGNTTNESLENPLVSLECFIFL